MHTQVLMHSQSGHVSRACVAVCTCGVRNAVQVLVLYFFIPFIHYGDLYSAPSRLLLRSAPDPCTAKKKSFETRVECVRKNPGEQSLRQRKPIPHRSTNHRECTGLGCGCTSKRNKE